MKKNGKALHQVEVVPISSLKPHPRNYRMHPDDQLAHLVESLKRFGVYRNVVVARDGTILAGHGVVEAAKKSKLNEIPVIRLDVAPSSAQAIKVLVGDNEVTRLAEQDDGKLVTLLVELKKRDGLLGTGFDDASFKRFIAELSAPEEFQEVGDDIHVEHTCPRCGYKFSGGAKAAVPRANHARSGKNAVERSRRRVNV